MNVLSLFDGISCGQVALNKAGVKVKNYYASEVDLDAIKVTQNNFHDTIQLGDIKTLDLNSLPKIDLLIGGSPCTGFSVSNNKRDGIEGISGKLFDYYVDVLDTLKPKFFLYENVSKMRKDDEFYITKKLNTFPYLINSDKFSPQSRLRNYWTNIKINPINFGNDITVRDIIDFTDTTSKIITRTPTYDNIRKGTSKTKINRIGYIDSCSRGNRIYSIDGKGVTLTRNSGGLGRCTGLYLIDDKIRRLTALEAERMQTLPDNYTSILDSDNKRLQGIGNGWTVDVIAYILKHIN